MWGCLGRGKSPFERAGCGLGVVKRVPLEVEEKATPAALDII